MTVSMTTQEIADKLQLDREVTYKLISFLENVKLIAAVGTKKVGDKGKGAKVFEFDPEKVGQHLHTLLVELTA